jgi:hypothetical protein
MNQQMKRFLGFCFGGFVLLTAAYWAWAAVGVTWFGSTTDICLGLYQTNARTPIFSGFITMGSFLLALKTNILARLKETYETTEYRENYRAHQEQKREKADRYFGTLERLSYAIGWNVIFCLTAALAQMTLGFVWKAWAFGICCGLATGTLLLLLYLTCILMAAHREWFQMIEDQAQKKLSEGS